MPALSGHCSLSRGLRVGDSVPDLRPIMMPCWVLVQKSGPLAGVPEVSHFQGLLNGASQPEAYDLGTWGLSRSPPSRGQVGGSVQSWVWRACKVRAAQAAQRGWQRCALGVLSEWAPCGIVGMAVVVGGRWGGWERAGLHPDHLLPTLWQCPVLCLH